mmetsp:Transcript_6679/g.9239  ORF Transcript_6679/g.9239 Transcript_6679/m.9239 type:complete len:192 (+) Transcript_6679:17-592(+)
MQSGIRSHDGVALEHGLQIPDSISSFVDHWKDQMQQPDMNPFLQYYIEVFLQQQREFQSVLADMDAFCEKKTKYFESQEFFESLNVGLVPDPLKVEPIENVPSGALRNSTSTEQEEQEEETFEPEKESNPKKKAKTAIPKSAIAILKSWLFSHYLHPYPTEEQKLELSEQTGLTPGQLNNWFINARRRILK